MDTTTDQFLNGRVVLQQPKFGYRAAIDPVLLAAAVPAKVGQKVLELGCGAGAAMFCLAARVSGLSITGVEIQPDYLACAEANVRHNAALGDVKPLAGDVRQLPASLAANSFDHVMANPPYHDQQAYDAGEHAGKTAAHAMLADDLGLWVKAAHGRLKHRGTLTMIYRADGLAELLTSLNGKFGGLTLFPLWPRVGESAKRIIVQGQKGSKAPLKLLAGLALHEDQAYSAMAEDILRNGKALW